MADPVYANTWQPWSTAPRDGHHLDAWLSAQVTRAFAVPGPKRWANVHWDPQTETWYWRSLKVAEDMFSHWMRPQPPGRLMPSAYPWRADLGAVPRDGSWFIARRATTAPHYPPWESVTWDEGLGTFVAQIGGAHEPVSMHRFVAWMQPQVEDRE